MRRIHVAILIVTGTTLLAAVADVHGQVRCVSDADCDDANICTLDRCDTFDGRCYYFSDVGRPCQPENHCYEAGTCDGAVCVPQGPFGCDDGNPCTQDGCDYTKGCTHVGETCDDQNACTTDACALPDVCSHQSIDCNDGDPCTLDGCNPASGCTHLGTNCDDGDVCTIDSCLSPGACAHEPYFCDDSNSCTHDDCDPVAGCTHRETGSCTENPKSVGYWQSVCRGNGNHTDSISDSDASFIHSVECSPYFVHSPDDVCRILLLSGEERCLAAEQEFLALALNLNHGRVSLYDGIDARCGYQVTVAGAFADARRTLCATPCLVEPCLGGSGDSCAVAECECREINQGRALHVHGLVVSRLASGAVRLSWIPPLGDAGNLAATPRRYRVWRATDANGPFMEIAEVSDPAYDDTAAPGARLVYDVTPVW